jgi:hypothetical protein
MNKLASAYARIAEVAYASAQMAKKAGWENPEWQNAATAYTFACHMLLYGEQYCDASSFALASQYASTGRRHIGAAIRLQNSML